MRIGVTGASGYVGTAFVASAVAAGHEVVALGRRPVAPYEWREHDLSEDVAAGLVADLDVVVHCAYDLRVTRREDIARINVGGTSKLLAAATRAGARFVLISSMSAYEGTRQIYGAAKLRSERDVLAVGGEAVRLGLVHGGPGGGMMASLERAVRSPVVPVVAASSWQFTLDVRDMCAALLAVLEQQEPLGEAVGLAHPTPVPFATLLREVARAQHRSPVFVPVPWRLVYLAMCAAERARVALPLRADSVLGLARPAVMVPHADLWPRLGVAIRPFPVVGVPVA